MNKNIKNLKQSKLAQNSVNSNVQNEKIKNKYYDYLHESQGYSNATIEAIKKAIYRYEEFTYFEDFIKFDQKRAVDFKKWIEEKKSPRNDKQISLSTCYYYLKHLKDFFKWLSYQPGYKSKICLTDVEYLEVV
jgi:site-specific recombinase XerD